MNPAKAGEQHEPIRLLALRQDETGWAWVPGEPAWARAERSERYRLYSKIGLGADAITFTLHRRALTLHNAILWRGAHCALTALRTQGLFLQAEAALVQTVPCVADAHRTPHGVCFPGILTEKYLRHTQLEPMAVNTICYVLVTPKAVTLAPGSLVDIEGVPFQVLVEHVLDDYKNEYEVMRKRDL